MAKLQSDLSEFVALLNSHGVEYDVVGGHAVVFHGHPRLTGDIDFFLRSTRENAERVLLVLRDFGFGTLELRVDDLIAPERIIQLGRPPNRIDLLTSIFGISFDEAWATGVCGRAGRTPSPFSRLGSADSEQDCFGSRQGPLGREEIEGHRRAENGRLACGSKALRFSYAATR